MRIIFIGLAALTPFAASAAQPQRTVEDGVPQGSLAVAAIEHGDFTRAERQLAGSSLDADDPALLINLGTVYWRQGRTAEAQAAWRSAMAAPSRIVGTADGHFARTDDLARTALARFHRTSMASR